MSYAITSLLLIQNEFEVTNKIIFFYVNRNYFANENFNTHKHLNTVGNYAFVSFYTYACMYVYMYLCMKCVTMLKETDIKIISVYAAVCQHCYLCFSLFRCSFFPIFISILLSVSISFCPYVHLPVGISDTFYFVSVIIFTCTQTRTRIQAMWYTRIRTKNTNTEFQFELITQK